MESVSPTFRTHRADIFFKQTLLECLIIEDDVKGIPFANFQLKFIFWIVTILSVGEVLSGSAAREKNLSGNKRVDARLKHLYIIIIFPLIGSSKRVQMRIYRGPSNGHKTQYGYFIRQPSFD